MNIETKYSLDEDDYLAYQLYAAANNGRIRGKRKKSWALTAITFLALGMLFYSSDNSILGTYFVVATILTVFFFPLYSRWRYKNHYLRHTREIHKNSFGKEVTVKISDSIIETNDYGGQACINLSQLTEISETGQHFFLMTLSGHALILPKRKLDNLQEFMSAMKEISVKLNIKHNIDNDWKWK